MRLNRTCKYCNKFFPLEEGRVFSNHVRWCDKNTTNGDKGKTSLALKAAERINNELGSIKDFHVSCKKCCKTFQVKEREKKHPEREEYFCSRNCANSRGPRSEDFKRKVRESLLKSRPPTLYNKVCQSCEGSFQTRKKHVAACSRICAIRHQNRFVDKTSLKYYRSLCQFKFNLADYPGEFDFSLVEQHGWYAAKNRGDNLGGVSRDHIVSVRYGFDNKVDPAIISHPANCRLLVQNKNASKGQKSDLCLQELLDKIQRWNAKYNLIQG